MSGLRVRPLVVVAVSAERAAILRTAPSAQVVVCGVGPVAAAVATTRALAEQPGPGAYSHVISLGIAGAFASDSSVLLATKSVPAELGVEAGEDLSAMGLGGDAVPADPVLVERLRHELGTGVAVGDLLTVWRVTASAESAARLRARYPSAVGEAMEGWGVGTAAAAAGLPFAEVRAVSNLIGPRDREAWDISGALSRLAEVAEIVLRDTERR